MHLSRQQTALLGIFILFLGPLLLVMLMRSSWWGYLPEELSNHGRLMQPPVALPLTENPAIAGKWLLLYRLPEPCGRNCLARITAMRQIHKAAGREQLRLTVALISKNHPDTALKTRIESIYSRFELITDAPASVFETLARINPETESAAIQGGNFDTFILDPEHLIILAYNTNNNPGDINTDLQRLLKWSQ